MNEFVDIPDYEGYYKIHTTKGIKSEDRWVNANKGGQMLIKARLFAGWKGSDGYIHVKLCKDGKAKSLKMHQILAMVFIPNPNNYPCVRHLNDVRDDNRIENLAWGTRKDNAYDQIRNGQFKSVAKKGRNNFMYGKKGELSPNYGRKAPAHEKTCKMVIDLQTGIFYDSIREAARIKGMSEVTLNQRLSGRLKNNTLIVYA